MTAPCIQSTAFMRDVPLTRKATFDPRETPYGPNKTDDWPAQDFARRLRSFAHEHGVAQPTVVVERKTWPAGHQSDEVRFDPATHAAIVKARLEGDFFSVAEYSPDRAPTVQVPWIIKNATPHAITLLIGESGRIVIPASPGDSRTARVSEVADIADEGIGSIRYGDVEGLPEPQDGVLWIVSKMTAIAVAASGSPRGDLVVIGREVRDTDGRIIAGRGLARIESAS